MENVTHRLGNFHFPFGGEGEKIQQLRSEKFRISARLARLVETVCARRAGAKEASCISGITKEDLFPPSTVTKSLPLV